ncbi:hypothetical protein MHTCC0001_10670 [Flavobacteriaceae bacterium MHTCC 0001]
METENRKITIPLQNGFEVFNVIDVLYCKADDNYTLICFKSERKVLVSKTLKYVEDTLGTMHFARVHKSYLVNVNEIEKYLSRGKLGSIILSNGKEIAVSSSKKAYLFSYFKKL